MYPRTTVTLLILVLLICPVQCAWGMCHDPGCDDGLRQTEVTASASECCCCSHGDAETPEPGECDDTPLPCSDDADCQGVCSGAMQPKTGGVDDLVLTVIAVPVVEMTAPCPASHAESIEQRAVGSGNRGRFLCTLHETLNC